MPPLRYKWELIGHRGWINVTKLLVREQTFQVSNVVFSRRLNTFSPAQINGLQGSLSIFNHEITKWQSQQ